ncbi:MAG: hypothetical protein U9O89_02170, partial [Thermoproteota archaeon]|nr:hypothetical protein [Thermoproteota archaeon]
DHVMSKEKLPPTVFHMLEQNLGHKLLLILDEAYGFEGTLKAVTRNPPGIWLSNADAVILRSTIAKPVPEVAAREERSEVFVNLNSVRRIELLHEKP